MALYLLTKPLQTNPLKLRSHLMAHLFIKSLWPGTLTGPFSRPGTRYMKQTGPNSRPGIRYMKQTGPNSRPGTCYLKQTGPTSKPKACLGWP